MRIQRLLLILFLFNTQLWTQAQTDTSNASFFDKSLVTPKIIAARHEFHENNMRGSLLIYREVLETEPNNANALYGASQCYYHLKKYKLSLEYLEKAIAVKPNVSRETEFYRGQIYHRTGHLDDAVAAFRRFMLEENPKSYEFEMAVYYIEQCLYAKEMMTNPVPVEISNLGIFINSRYDDYTPSITADGKKLVFTARRSDTEGGRMDEAGDYKYFEDIYVSEWDEESGEWGQAYAATGELNTVTYDAVLSIFPSGTGMYVYKNTVNTTGDIYYSEYRPGSGEWSAAQKMPRPVNTSYFEGSVSQTADGSTLYFVSERPEGQGQGDIYVATKKGSGWSSPKNLGQIINTELDEKFVFIHPNGKTLYFASDGHQTMGSYDIFKSELVNGEWSIPINLGYPINTVNEESTFSLTSDNKTLYIAAEYDDSYGERDIYRIDVSNYPLVSQGYDMNTSGQILITCTNKAGEPQRDVKVIMRYASNDKQIIMLTTDKLGRAKVNLPGNQKYKIEISYDTFSQTEIIDLKLKSQGETVIKYDVQITP
jgi:tetratricopeptide (TPR) repeat protein